MFDFILEEIIPRAAIILILMFFIFIFVLLPLGLLFGGPSRQEQMYQHCIEDGNKDYVCYQLTHVHSQQTYVPVPVPMKVR